MPPVSTHEEQQRQLNALHILETRETLVWHANHKNESVVQIALRHEKLFYGIDPDADKPLFTDAAYGVKIPESILNGKKSRGTVSTRDAAGSSTPRAEPASSSRAATSSSRSSARKQANAERPDTVSTSRSGQMHRSVKDGAGSTQGDNAVKVEHPSPSQLRRSRSERSSGGSQTPNAKKRARKSATGS